MEQLQNLDLSPMSAVGAALLRLILAAFWIVHWWFKVGYRSMPATEAFFLQQGLPAWLAWFDISFQVVIAVCLVLGIFVPLLCLIALPILFASMWIYRRNEFYFSGGGIELPVLWACAQIAQVFLGPGAFRITLPVWLQLPTLFGVPLWLRVRRSKHETRSHLSNLHDGEGAVTGPMMLVTEFSSLFITSRLLLDIRCRLIERASFHGVLRSILRSMP
jgi:putative oxidoreductase